MSANAPATPFRAILRLHQREDAGQGGKLRLLLIVARLLVMAFIGLRIFTLTASWESLPANELYPRIWVLLLGSWLSVLVMAALATLQTALSRREIGILLPMPLDHATRWRLVLLRVASSFGILMIGGMLVTAAALSQFGIGWGVALLLLMPSALCLGVLLPLFIAWLLGNGQPRRRAIATTLTIPALLVLALTLTRPAGNLEVISSPLLMLPDAILIPAIVLGFGARRLGRWYLTLAQELHAAPVRTRDFLGPLSPALGALLSRSRTPWAAIALKELRVQARDVFLLLRIAIILAAPPLFLLISDLPAFANVDLPPLIAAYALVLGIYCAIETTPSPFGGEGNRLALALLASPGPGPLIAGKALAVIAPLVAQVWLVILVLSIWHDAPILRMVGNALLATIAVASIGFVMTCISTRDIDVRQPVEGGAQAVLVEHVPNTPVRLAIVGCALALALGASAAIIVLPWLASFATVIIGCVLACTLVYRDAARTLTRTIAR